MRDLRVQGLVSGRAPSRCSCLFATSDGAEVIVVLAFELVLVHQLIAGIGKREVEAEISSMSLAKASTSSDWRRHSAGDKILNH